ncbi:ATP-binding protein [Streptosporangium canum]|uniref:ATP-binding protein n=1 Tax=Streptosporangium canum TaxID=324952 RepID=UPI0034152E45
MNPRGAEARPRGRHRRGTLAAQVEPRGWDLAEQASAERLDQGEPLWTVWYGLGARCFYAVAAWPAPGPLIVRASTADELRDLMREAGRASPSSPRLTPHGPAHPPPPALDRPVPIPRPTADRPDRTPPPPPHLPTSPPGALMPATPDDPRTVCWTLPHELSIVGKARGMVNETLTAWALHSLADDVVLVAGELLANAITHGEPLVRLSLWAGADELCVRVTDHGPEQPRHLDLGVEAVHGRGLTIVEALADDSGVIPLPDRPGKTVWARWDIRARSARSAL